MQRNEALYCEDAQTYWELPDWVDMLFVQEGQPDYTHFVAHGGRNFGHKSETAHAAAVLLAQDTPLNVLCLRHQQNALSDSAYATAWAWMNHTHNPIRKTHTRVYTDAFGGTHEAQDFWRQEGNRIVGKNGSVFMFRGCSTSRGTDESLRSIKNVHLVIVDEAQLLQKDAFEVVIPSLLRSPKKAFAGGHGTKIWYLMNPETSADPVWQLVIHADKSEGRIRVKKMRMEDTPYMPQALIDEMERDRKNDPLLFGWKWEGDFRPLDGEHPCLLRRGELEEIYRFSMCNWEWIKGLMLKEDGSGTLSEPMAGADIARSASGDAFTYAMRRGPVVYALHEWRGHDFRDSWERIKRVSDVPPDILFFDHTGIGAGFGDMYPDGFEDVRCRGVSFGGAVEGKKQIYDRNVDNEEMFFNLGAQMYFHYKLRADNTLALIRGDKEINLMDCLFFGPEIDKSLILKLADQGNLASYFPQGDRKMRVEKTRKGMPSPDLLDAIALAFYYEVQWGLRASSVGRDEPLSFIDLNPDVFGPASRIHEAHDHRRDPGRWIHLPAEGRDIEVGSDEYKAIVARNAQKWDDLRNGGSGEPQQMIYVPAWGRSIPLNGTEHKAIIEENKRRGSSMPDILPGEW